MTELERVVHIDYNGRRFTFRTELNPPYVFWRVEADGRVFHSTVCATGNETDEFFRSLAKTAIDHYGL